MQVGFLGTGLMGAPMALRLLAQGHTVMAWNRSSEKLVPLAEQGVRVLASPAEVLQACECCVLMLTDAAAIEATVLNSEAKAALAGKTLVQMGTIAPEQSQALAIQVEAAGGHYLEATVLGSIPEANAGTLIVMVGAKPEDFERWYDLLVCFGPEPKLMGPVGTGAAVKLAMNQLIGTLTSSFAMSLGLVQQAGIDVADFMAIVRQSALYAPTFDKKLARMCDHNYANPNFPTKHLLKDMALFVQAAEAAGINSQVAHSVAHVATLAIETGFADSDYAAIFEAIAPPGKASVGQSAP
jgi:3-hydroxyisobutyrate dehydrogenase